MLIHTNTKTALCIIYFIPCFNIGFYLVSSIVALSVQVNIQLFLHIFWNFLGNRTMLCTRHMLSKCCNKSNILCHMLCLHDIHCIITIVDGSCISRCNTCERNSRNTLIASAAKIRVAKSRFLRFWLSEKYLINDPIYSDKTDRSLQVIFTDYYHQIFTIPVVISDAI